MATNEATAEKLITDLKVLARDAEDLLKATASHAGDRLGEVRTRLAEALESAKANCHRLEAKAIAGAKAADHAIREHPYESLGLALGMGLLVGVLVGRR